MMRKWLRHSHAYGEATLIKCPSNRELVPRIVNRVGKEYNDFCIVVGEPKIGEGTWVGYFTLLDGSGGLEIGKHCSIASGVHIYTHDSVRWTTQGLEKDHEGYTHLDRAPVRIGDNVFIGANTVVCKGVVIEDKSVVGAGSVVTEGTRIRSGQIWGGSPARPIGRLKTRRAPHHHIPPSV